MGNRNHSSQPEEDKTSTRFNTALTRNLNEVLMALYECTALKRLEESYPEVVYDEDFFGIAHDALFNDMIAHSAKLFDKHRDSASFWYIYQQKEEDIEGEWNDTNNLDTLELISKKLKHVRDKTHFHIDKKGVVDTKSVWRAADFKLEFLEDCLLLAYETLNYVFKLETDADFGWKSDTYTGQEISHYIDALKSHGYLR